MNFTQKIYFHFNKIVVSASVWLLSKGNYWKNVQGVLLPLMPQAGYSTNRWIVNGRYEMEEINIIKARLHTQDRVLEIGTGLGFVSTYCSRVIGSDKVFTYEANTNNIPLIKKVFKKNNVDPSLTNALLSSKNGTASFPVNTSNLLGSSLFINNDNHITVPQIILNEVIKNIQPTFLIMDIEGGEFDIFSMISFQSIKKIQFELHPAILGNEKCEQIFNILHQHGFVQDKEICTQVNFYFYKQPAA